MLFPRRLEVPAAVPLASAAKCRRRIPMRGNPPARIVAAGRASVTTKAAGPRAWVATGRGSGSRRGRARDRRGGRVPGWFVLGPDAGFAHAFGGLRRAFAPAPRLDLPPGLRVH